MSYSRELIQKTIDTFQPYYNKQGIKLTEQDAIEIIENTTGFAECLMEMDRKHKECPEKDS
ncbi:MAG: hypothetical protein ABIE75_01485 [Candidatus Omnitrophota bacterium]